MKRLITFLLVLTMAMCLVACGEDATTPDDTDPTTTASVPTSSTVDNTVYNYKIRVVDQDGNPIEGAFVQFCLETCDFFETNEEGWALIDKPIADGYKAHIISLPEGYESYTFSAEDTYFEAGQTEMILVATKPAA